MQFDFTNYDYSRNLLIYWPKWVWKTYEAQKLFDAFDNPRKYRIKDGIFKKHVESNNLWLRAPIDWQTWIEFYPMEIMIRSQLLFFDDLGVSDGSEAYIKNLTFMLDERIERWLTTIFTTNLSMPEIEKKLDERIASRVLLNTDIIVMKWDDRRKATSRIFEYTADSSPDAP